jgi:AraC-like DNA-binding protein
MKKSLQPAVHNAAPSQNTKRNVSIIRYDSDVATTDSKIQLKQNLFSFLLEGNKSVQYAGKKVMINPNQFFLLSAGNCLMSEKIAAAGGRYRSVLFFFDTELLSDFLNRHPSAIQSIQSKQTEEPFLVFEKDAFLINFINSLGIILASGQSLSSELQLVKLEELLVYIHGRYPELIYRIQHYNYEADEDLRIRQAIEANIYSSITVEALAFLCYMSLSTFKRRFAKIYGSSPNKWLLNHRMEKAAQILKQSDRKASEIYLEFGYENLSSFIQSFKQVHGITPKQYQQNGLNV